MKIFWLLAGLLALVTVIWFGGEKRVLTTYFVDESDNFVVGQVVKNGGKVYREVFTHHQPLTYAISSVVQRVTRPNTVWMLVKRHREVLMLWAMLWWSLMVLRFGWPALSVGIVYEWIKFQYLGNLFLAESLVTYPVLYMVLWWFRGKDSWWSKFFFGVAVATTTLALAPTWPFVFLFLVLSMFRCRFNFKRWQSIVVGALVIVLPMILVVDLSQYVKAMVINRRYYIPQYQPNFWGDFLGDGLLTPFKMMFTRFDDPTVGLAWKLWGIIFWLGVVWQISKKRIWLVLFWFLILGILNIRANGVGKIGYDGFHLLPWFGVLLTICCLSLEKLFEMTKIGAILMIVVSLTPLIRIKALNYDQTIEREFHVHYSRQVNLASGINLIAREGDELQMLSDKSLVFWQSGVKLRPADRFIFFYPWMWNVPEFRQLVETRVMAKPKFIYWEHFEYSGLKPPTGYHQFSYRGEKAGIFVRDDVYQGITPEQKGELDYLGIEVL